MEQQFDEDLNQMMALVNFAFRIRSLIVEEGYTQLWLRNPDTGELRRVTVLLPLNVKQGE
jgi:hypothetical protein